MDRRFVVLTAAAITIAGTTVLIPSQVDATNAGGEAAFRAAWSNVNETKIDLTADVSLTCSGAGGNGVAVRNSATAITVDGHGHTITQTCTTAANNGVLESDGSGGVTIQNVTITGGNGNTTNPLGGAGGVLANGPLSLSSCTLRNNAITSTSESAGGVAGLNGNLTITGCTLSTNMVSGAGEVGGAVVHDGNGSLSVTDSALTGNTATGTTNSDVAGGLVNNGGPTNITRSSITSNHATGVNVGGGVVNESGTETTVNSTISGNTATSTNGSSNLGVSGGILNQGGPETLTYVTLDGNTGSTGATNDAANYVNQGGNVQFFASVVGDPHNGPNCLTWNGTTFTSNGRNLEDDSGASCGFSTAAHDIVGQSPQLNPLGNNGGPGPTQLPKPTSPLINLVPAASCQAGTATGVTTDERGITRPQGPGCDTGAVEVQQQSSQCVTGSPAGSVTLTGSTACVNGANIGGSLVIPAGTSATITNSQIGGSVSGNGAGSVTICGSHIGGSLSITNSTGPVVIGDDGDDPSACAANVVDGGATVSGNKANAELGGNQLKSSVTFDSNLGTGGIETSPEVEGNTIGGSLACTSNSSVSNDGHANSVAAARTGQCAGL